MTGFDESWWVRVLAGPGGEIDSARVAESYVALPRPGDPRVVVDASSGLAVRDAVERFVASRTNNAMARSLAGRVASVVSKAAGAWSVASAPGGRTLRAHLSEVLDEPVQLSVAVGPPRPNRKPVIRCYNDDQLVAVAKLGPDPHTAAMVANETYWLRQLASDPLVDVLVPALVHAGEFGDSALLVMAPMDLTSDLGVDFADVPLSVVREFTRRYEDETDLRDGPWWRELADRLDRPELAAVAEQARRIEDDPMLDELRVSAWHGDWSPWNMGRAPSGELYVWDWERTSIGVPAGFDVVHLHHQYGSGLHAAYDDLRALELPDEHHRLTKQLYLLELCARHADAGVLASAHHTKTMDALGELRASGSGQ